MDEISRRATEHISFRLQLYQRTRPPRMDPAPTRPLFPFFLCRGKRTFAQNGEEDVQKRQQQRRIVCCLTVYDYLRQPPNHTVVAEKIADLLPFLKLQKNMMILCAEMAAFKAEFFVNKKNI